MALRVTVRPSRDQEASMSNSIACNGIAPFFFALSLVATGCAVEPQPEPLRATSSHLDNANLNGLCGLANMQVVANRPEKNLCSAGVASGVSGSGPWDWSCAGTGRGTTAHCSALSTSVDSPNATRDQHGALLKAVYAEIFGQAPSDYVYFYWVDRYNPAAGIGCRAILQAFVLASPARAPAEAATSASDPALTGYIHMLYRALLPTYPGDHTDEIASWRMANYLTMDQLDGIFLDDDILKKRCSAVDMQF
jgi:hypothetical protein